MIKYFLGRHNTCPLTQYRDPMTDWSMEITKVQLDEPMRFIGVTHRNMNEELHTGADMNQRYLCHQSLPQ